MNKFSNEATLAEHLANHFMAEHADGSVDEGQRQWAIDQMKANPAIVIHVAESIGRRRLAGTPNDFEYAVEVLADLLTR
ncbi:MAG: hypothetical protein IOD15_11270 [Phycisphaerales bacterium]|nr:hypothetical protein [Phycisphaerales bacterium]